MNNAKSRGDHWKTALAVLCHGPDRQVIDLLDVFGLSYSQGGERGKEDVVGSPCGGQLVLWQHGHRGSHEAIALAMARRTVMKESA